MAISLSLHYFCSAGRFSLQFSFRMLSVFFVHKTYFQYFFPVWPMLRSKRPTVATFLLSAAHATRYDFHAQSIYFHNIFGNLPPVLLVLIFRERWAQYNKYFYFALHFPIFFCVVRLYRLNWLNRFEQINLLCFTPATKLSNERAHTQR